MSVASSEACLSGGASHGNCVNCGAMQAFQVLESQQLFLYVQLGLQQNGIFALIVCVASIGA